MSTNFSNCDIVPVTQSIARAKMTLNLDNSDYDLYFEILVDECLKRFTSPSTLIPIKKRLEIYDNKIALPLGVKEVMGVYIGDENCNNSEDLQDAGSGLNRQPTNIPLVFYSRPLAGICHNGTNILENSMQVENGYIILNFDTDETSALVSYIGYNTDENGVMMIYDSYTSCIANYIVSEFLFSNPEWYGQPNVTESRRQIAYRKYLAEKNQIKAQEKRIEFRQERFALDLVFDRVHINDTYNYPYL